ncbi:MAG: DUF1616 domain-containing protein [Methanomassiliicoccales archaeon]|nr:DUF1616 domain-containing protein [Methanomassiliicoccales archaeon]
MSQSSSILVRSLDLVLVALAETIIILFALVAPGAPYLWVPVLPAVFFVPGYSLVSALFPEPFWTIDMRDRWRIAAAERALGSFVVSLMVVALVGSFFSWSEWGVGTASGAAILLISTYVGCAIAVHRRSKVRGFSAAPGIPSVGKHLASPNSKEKVVGLTAIAVVVLAAAALIVAPVPSPEPYTQFALLGPSGTLVDIPQNLSVGQIGTVRLEVLNSMAKDMSYNLTVGLERNGAYQNYSELNWSVAHAFAPGDALTANISVANGATYARYLSFSLQSSGRQQVMFNLTGPGVSEQLWLWITVT